MKHIFTSILCLCSLALFAENQVQNAFSAPMPSIGDASITICGQNLQNYYLNLENSFSSSSTQEQFDKKTNRIVDAFLAADADIYAMCELEVSDTVVSYITEAMNTAAGSRVYSYVQDDMYDLSDGATKAGFIYRLSTVKPVGSNNASAGGTVYRRRMRWQLFEELATSERFVVSMNHFKAKSGSDDSTTNEQRMTNAANLVNAMSTMLRSDSDIIVMGDLNCQVDEEPILYLINNGGLTEQLLAYDAGAYSHTYNGKKELIDHAMTNVSASRSVTGAGVCHVNTNSSYYSSKFSDHDLYLIGLSFASGSNEEKKEVVLLDEPFSASIGSFVIEDVLLPEEMEYIWTYDSRYGMKASGYSGGAYESESWLISPTLDMKQYESAKLTFDHVYRYTSTPATDLSLLVSTDYDGSNLASANWKEVKIPSYSSGSDWNFVSSGNIDLSTFVGASMTFALRYTSTSSTASTWEVKNMKLSAVVGGEQTSLNSEVSAPQARKFLQNGVLYIERDGCLYTIFGSKL